MSNTLIYEISNFNHCGKPKYKVLGTFQQNLEILAFALYALTVGHVDVIAVVASVAMVI